MEFIDINMMLVISNVLLLVLLMSQSLRTSSKFRVIFAEHSRLNADLSALCRGATNIDRRLELMSSQIKRVIERQDNLETSDVVKREYDHAIRAIKNGASADRLVDMHGFSAAEARLLVSLHGEECGA